MENGNDIKNPTVSTDDKGEDSEERRDAAQQAWRDKQGIPRGTPEQTKRAAEPEIEDEANESATKRTPEVDDVANQDKRRAAPEQAEPDGPSGEGTGPKNG